MAWDYLNTIGFRGCARTRQARKYLLHMGFFTCSKMAKVELSIRHDVGIWDEQGLLLTWARVPAGTAAPLVGEYRYTPAPQVLLLTGHSYVVGATAPVSLSNPPGWLTDMYPNSTIEIDTTKIAADPRLYLVVADRYYSDIRGGYSDPLVFPSYHAPAGYYFDFNTGEVTGTIYPYLLAANFQFVPEPGTLVFLTGGVLLLMRRNSGCRRRSGVF